VPSPPRQDDPVYCLGVVVGHFHGEYTTVPDVGTWCLVIKDARELPPALAEHRRRNLQSL
jgi:hypothetical protein